MSPYFLSMVTSSLPLQSPFMPLPKDLLDRLDLQTHPKSIPFLPKCLRSLTYLRCVSSSTFSHFGVRPLLFYNCVVKESFIIRRPT